MNSLPPEVYEKIFSFLSLNDRVNCRSVCQWFKNSVDFNLASLTNLRMISEEFEEETRVYSYAQEQFFSGSFCQVFIRRGLMSKHLLFQFLGKFCPNLHVLDAIEFNISYADLLQISGGLSHLKCHQIDCKASDLLLPSVLSNQPIDDQIFDHSFRPCDQLELLKEKLSSHCLFEPFQNLQVLDCESNCFFDSLTLSKFLMHQNRPVSIVSIDLCERKVQSIDDHFFKNLVSCQLACLELYLDSSSSSLIPKSLAESLVDLSIHFESKLTQFYRNCEAFFNGPFPNLTYLTVECKYSFDSREPSIHSALLFSRPQLKRFTYKGRIYFDTLRQLFDQLNSIETLQIVQLDINRYIDTMPLKIELPPKIVRFTLGKDVPFDFSNSFFHSLTHFDASFLKIYNFTTPNLQQFRVTLTEQSQYLSLLDFLVHSPKLRSLEIYWNFKPSQVQSLIDFLPCLSCLKQVELKGNFKNMEELVTIQQARFPTIEFFGYCLRVNTFFYPVDSFDSLEVYKTVLSFKSNFNCFTFSREMFTVAETPLRKLREVYLGNIMSPNLESIMRIVELYTKVKSVKFEVNESSFYSMKYYRQKFGMFVEWLCSCPSLSSVEGPFDEEFLNHLVTNLEKPGPLELKVKPLKAKII